ncbi:MAG TPA: ribonuclease PH [Candidatus Hydrogenedentes bacterium]|nr:ribonuclease PH [Candidatus Hydrogenedentota bacterium]HRK36330.1 ribonuclease PH [Candidatus Hydrogenedentota bacterium]
MSTRPDGRANDALRPVTIERQYTKFAEGSVLITFGDTKVLCTATVEERIPPFLRDTGKGWVTAEYGMLPGSSHERISRDSVKKGRAMEISRLIGRSLRCVVDLARLGERQILIDCDVLQADGGTRTASITGAYVALHDAVSALVSRGTITATPILHQCAAVSVGVVGGVAMLDLCYAEDSSADVDMNLVLCDDGRFVEVQGSAEGAAFSRDLMDQMLSLGEKGAGELFQLQRLALGIAS